MKLQELVIIFIIIIFPITVLLSFYISSGTRTLTYQSLYDHGLVTATHDAIYAFELNTTNDAYSDNAETKRNILKSSVKQFEKSLANACNISAYNVEVIEEYIPAVVFGMYDGFYLYAPSYNSQTGKYEHNLKNYVYYSENLNNNISILYSLDSYVVVSGDFGNGYEVRSGYLLNPEDTNQNGTKYKGITISKETLGGVKNEDAIHYYQEAYQFSKWFLETAKIPSTYSASFLDVRQTGNDPEDENSAFVQHKRQIMREKIQSVLNSTITAYAKRLGNYNYKMPNLSEEDWQKIFADISMISFFQGKKIGLTTYNGYCVLNSTNHNEYPNPNLLYFIDENSTYHDIRCTHVGNSLTGYRIGRYQKKKIRDEETNQYRYQFENEQIAEAYACYDCINGQKGRNTTPIFTYIMNQANKKTKKAYFTALARERYTVAKLTPSNEKDEKTMIMVNVVWEDNNNQEGYRSDYSISLYQNTNQFIKKIEGSETTIQFTNLPKYDQYGDNIPYSIKATLKENSSKYDINLQGNETVITVTFRLKELTDPGSTDKNITVQWNDPEHPQHEEIEFYLDLCCEEELYVENIVRRVTVNFADTMSDFTDNDNTVSVLIENIPVYTSEGDQITYYFSINNIRLNETWQAIDNRYEVQYNKNSNMMNIRYR